METLRPISALRRRHPGGRRTTLPESTAGSSAIGSKGTATAPPRQAYQLWPKDGRVRAGPAGAWGACGRRRSTALPKMVVISGARKSMRTPLIAVAIPQVDLAEQRLVRQRRSPRTVIIAVGDPRSIRPAARSRCLSFCERIAPREWGPRPGRRKMSSGLRTRPQRLRRDASIGGATVWLRRRRLRADARPRASTSMPRSRCPR